MYQYDQPYVERIDEGGYPLPPKKGCTPARWILGIMLYTKSNSPHGKAPGIREGKGPRNQGGREGDGQEGRG